MKILDLGCSDGGLMEWLTQQNIHIEQYDGIDLDTKQVKTARQRAKKLGVKGDYKVGNVLDTPTLYDEHQNTYDMVVAYEVLEHMKTPGELLDVMERMVHPDGRVVISTPDGVFGTGGNPHHLHTFRAEDIAEMMMQRGNIMDFEVGEDHVVTVAYTPREKMGEVAIYLGPCWEKWSPLDINTRGLGGSETAAAKLGEQLADKGYVVTVYGDVEPTLWRGVLCKPHGAFDPAGEYDILIGSRGNGLVLADANVEAKHKVLWAHDVNLGPLTPERASYFDRILGLSEWHVGKLRELYPFASNKIVQFRNGIEPLLYPTNTVKETQRANRVVYSSSPDRGLDLLLEIWPTVRKEVPDAELVYCYPDVYDAVADQQPVVGEYREKIRDLAIQDGVRRLGALSQPALAELLMGSRVWVGVSWASPQNERFYETSCIAAMEAQSAGCCVIASPWGALTETVENNRMLTAASPVEGNLWRDDLANSIVRSLTDAQWQQDSIDYAAGYRDSHAWCGVVDELLELLDR